MQGVQLKYIRKQVVKLRNLLAKYMKKYVANYIALPITWL